MVEETLTFTDDCKRQSKNHVIFLAYNLLCMVTLTLFTLLPKYSYSNLPDGLTEAGSFPRFLNTFTTYSAFSGICR